MAYVWSDRHAASQTDSHRIVTPCKILIAHGVTITDNTDVIIMIIINFNYYKPKIF